jgi:hypothetical protein
MLLWPQLPPTVVEESERPCLVGTGPGMKLQMQPLWPHRAPTKAAAGSGSVSRWDSRRVAMPDGSDAMSPSTAAKGRSDLLVFRELRGDLERWTDLGFVLIEEGGQREHVQRTAYRVLTGISARWNWSTSYPSGITLASVMRSHGRYRSPSPGCPSLYRR